MPTKRAALWCGGLLITLSITPARADQAAFTTAIKATSGLIGYWPFEGDHKNQAGSGYNARTEGASSLITPCEGVKGGKGVRIDNSAAGGQYLEVETPIGSSFDTRNSTVVVWARVTAPPQKGIWQMLVERNGLWYLALEGMGDREGRPGYDFVTRIYDSANPGMNGTEQVRDEKVYLRPGEWHMYAFTYDGAVMISYLDGKEVFRKPFKDGIGPTNETPRDAPYGNYNLTWGAWQQRDDWFTGSFDDTALFNRALSAAEIRGLYDTMMK
jgi:hypothetical protein